MALVLHSIQDGPLGGAACLRSGDRRRPHNFERVGSVVRTCQPNAVLLYDYQACAGGAAKMTASLGMQTFNERFGVAYLADWLAGTESPNGNGLRAFREAAATSRLRSLSTMVNCVQTERRPERSSQGKLCP